MYICAHNIHIYLFGDSMWNALAKRILFDCVLVRMIIMGCGWCGLNFAGHPRLPIEMSSFWENSRIPKMGWIGPSLHPMLFPPKPSNVAHWKYLVRLKWVWWWSMLNERTNERKAPSDRNIFRHLYRYVGRKVSGG